MNLDPLAIDPVTAAAVRELGIPPCPDVLAAFMQEIARNEPDMRRLGTLISSDVGLAAAVIRTVNSPLFGPGARATTVNGALAALGLRRCANLIAGLLLRKAFSPLGDPALHAFWDESARHADVLTRLARHLRVIDASEAHTFGLFRDCGVPVLLRHFFDYGALYSSEHSQGMHALEGLETARYSADHATVGSVLAHGWHLPESIWGAIQCHHLEVVSAAVSPAARRLACASVLAECLDRSLRAGTQGPGAYWRDKQVQAAGAMGLDDKTVDTLRGELAADAPP